MKKLPIHVVAFAVAPLIFLWAIIALIQNWRVLAVVEAVLTLIIVAAGFRALSIERKRRRIREAHFPPFRGVAREVPPPRRNQR